MSAADDVTAFFRERSAEESEPIRAERAAVRRFVAESAASGLIRSECDSWMSGFSPGFSQALGARGWLGMVWPTEYGGRGLSPQMRLAVIEELLAAGAPIAAHWFADRQVGPSLLKHGTQEQRKFFLPPMARGEMYFCIGMSEPESGSDLGSVSTRASRTDSGWSITGQKIWTSHAADAHYMLALVRTGDRDQPASTALTQVIVDMQSPGITVRPIEMMDGRADFCEVFLDDVAVPDTRVVGEVGTGWPQVLAELVFERSGPERFLSTLPLIEEFVSSIDENDDAGLAEVGSMIARLATLRAMSTRVSQNLGRSSVGGVAAALVKDVGTRAELDSIEVIARSAAHHSITTDGEFRRHLYQARSHSAGFTLRGGTNEILRGIVARAVMPR
jgi:hypothetical protein